MTGHVHLPTCMLYTGQGRQVPSDPGGEQNPQTGPLLQDEEGPAAKLEVVSTHIEAILWQSVALGCTVFNLTQSFGEFMGATVK